MTSGTATTLTVEDRTALRDSVRRLLLDKSKEVDVRRTMETESGFDADLWRQLGEMGITGLMIDEEYGGSGVSSVELEAVMEEAGAALLCSPLLASSVITAELLRALDDAETNKRLLPTIASGECIACSVLTGDAGDWTQTGVAITAVKANQQWHLNGRGSYVLHGQNADVLIVLASVDGSLLAFEVDPAATGVSISALPTFDRTLRLAAIDFAGVEGRHIASSIDVGEAMRRALNLALVALAGEQAGGAQKVLEFTVEYAKTRIQFGRQIGSFQAIKHMAANLLIETESAISAARYAAAALADGRKDIDQAVSLAAFSCADAYVKTTADSVQMHGGIAFTWEHPAHLYLKRARADAQLFGNSATHRERYLQSLGG